MKKSAKRFALGALIAGAAGYVAGILTAPKSGVKTRKDVKKTAKKAKSRAESSLKTAYSQLDGALIKADKSVKTLKGEAKKKLSASLNRARRAKQQARETLSAFHEGEAGEENLRLAAKEAKKAASHLEKYIGHKANIIKSALKKTK